MKDSKLSSPKEYKYFFKVFLAFWNISRIHSVHESYQVSQIVFIIEAAHLHCSCINKSRGHSLLCNGEISENPFYVGEAREINLVFHWCVVWLCAMWRRSTLRRLMSLLGLETLGSGGRGLAHLFNLTASIDYARVFLTPERKTQECSRSCSSSIGSVRKWSPSQPSNLQVPNAGSEPALLHILSPGRYYCIGIKRRR